MLHVLIICSLFVRLALLCPLDCVLELDRHKVEFDSGFRFGRVRIIYKQVGEKLACALDKPFLLGVVRLVMYRFDISCKFTQLCERIYYRNGGLRGSWAFHYGSQHIQPSFGKGHSGLEHAAIYPFNAPGQGLPLGSPGRFSIHIE